MEHGTGLMVIVLVADKVMYLSLAIGIVGILEREMYIEIYVVH